MSRPELTTKDHKEAVSYFNKLITDLVLRELGLEHEPVTMERLDEAYKHIKDISQCKRPAIVRRGEWRRGGGAGAEYEYESYSIATQAEAKSAS